MTRTYEKQFGIFILNIEKGNKEVYITASINEGKTFNCKSFDTDKKAIVFYASKPITVNGKTIMMDGCFLPDFEEVYAQYTVLKNEIEEEKASEKDHEISDIKAGKKKIKVTYHDGEYLSAYEVYGVESELLEEVGAVKYIDSWGYMVRSDLVDALGTEFTYKEAVEFMEPENTAREKKLEDDAAKRQAVFEEAARTGEKQLLKRYTTECNDPNEECNLDIVYEYAMPDGNIETCRAHTW